MQLDAKLVSRCRENKVDLLRAALDLGITLAQRALEADSPEAAFRPGMSARRDFEIVLSWLRRIDVSPPEADEFAQKLYLLSTKLEGLTRQAGRQSDFEEVG